MSNDLNIKKLEFFRDEFTDCIFISNIKYMWKFILDNKPHTIILICTKLFSKRKVYLDNKEIYNSRKYTNNFNLSFPLEFYNITITQKNYFYTLKINNISFSNILNDLKLKKYNILENSYKEKEKQKKLRQLERRKNRILEETIKNLYKKEKMIKNLLNKNRKENGLETINEEIINTSNKLKEDSINEDDSKTIHESFEMHKKAFEMLDKNINNINTIDNNISARSNNNSITISDKKEKKDDKNNSFFKKKKKSMKSFKSRSKKDSFKPSEKIQYKTYENVNSSLNEMINFDLLEDETHNSDERNNTNLFRYNIFSNNNRSFFDKGSLTTQSN